MGEISNLRFEIEIGGLAFCLTASVDWAAANLPVVAEEKLKGDE
jgi:hypothetical protein